MSKCKDAAQLLYLASCSGSRFAAESLLNGQNHNATRVWACLAVEIPRHEGRHPEKRWTHLPDRDGVAEAKRIVEAANTRGLTLRLLGGLAFKLRSPSASEGDLKRNYVDIDLMGLRDESKKIQDLFLELGYQPRTTFNKMMGFARLVFNDFENERRVDIFLSVFEMCHKFDFSGRLKLSDLTLTPADLLLTKLQVYEFTDREYKDTIALLKDYELGDTDDDRINVRYIAKLASKDWGIWKTMNVNLDRLASSVGDYLNSEKDRELVSAKIVRFRDALQNEPKSLGWKIRARVGEQVRWYELPEADREVVDSRPPSGETASRVDPKGVA